MEELVGWIQLTFDSIFFGNWDRGEKTSHHDASGKWRFSTIYESMILCCHRDSWLVIFFTTPDLLDKPKSFILDHAFCFFSFSTLSTLPSMFFFGGGIPINLHLHLRCYFWPWSWWIVPYTLGIEATAGTKKTPWPRQHPKPWRLPQWRWPWSWGWKQNRVFVGGFGKDSGCVLYFFKVEIKLERRHMCRGRF